MYGLIFDTTAAGCGVCLQKDGKTTKSFEKEMDFGQAEELLPAISNLLQQEGILMADLSYIAVCTGPGSFTGVRACIAAARAFAIALPDCKIMGISAFDAYISDMRDDELADINAVIIETKRDDFYCEYFDKNRKKISDPVATDYDSIITALRGRKVSLTGDGVERFLAKPSGLSLHAIKMAYRLPLSALADCAYSKFNHKIYDFPKPLYLKAPDLGGKS